MTIFGAQGVRDSVVKAYQKHLAYFEAEPPQPGMTPHHAALHGALVLRYAASYRPVPEAIVWLEMGPFIHLPPGEAIEALAEYVVYKERPDGAGVAKLSDWLREGWEKLTEEEREMFASAATHYRFGWLKLLPTSSPSVESSHSS